MMQLVNRLISPVDLTPFSEILIKNHGFGDMSVILSLQCKMEALAGEFPFRSSTS